jgi:hypothetical protein
LTVWTRWFDGDTATTFNAWDYVYLNVCSIIIEDIQAEIDTKLADWDLRTWLTAYRTLYTDSSWNEQALAHWANARVLTSNWASANPSWNVATVDINWLTNDDWVLQTTDKLMFYDASEWSNNKRTAKASETIEWLVERATDAEMAAKTDTTRYVPIDILWKYLWTNEVGTFTRSPWSWAWTQAITHSLWRIPKYIKFDMKTELVSPTDWCQSNWWYDWTSNECVYHRFESWSDNVANSSNNWSIYATDANGDYYRWNVTAWTTTNFTVTWAEDPGWYAPGNALYVFYIIW